MTDAARETITVLDGGVLIALAVGEKSAQGLAEKIESEQGVFACTELALSELTYILCRKVGWDIASKKADSLVQSTAIHSIPAARLWRAAGRLKCRASIALSDCFTIAAAELVKASALFVQQEKELRQALAEGSIPPIVTFLR